MSMDELLVMRRKPGGGFYGDLRGLGCPGGEMSGKAWLWLLLAFGAGFAAAGGLGRLMR